MPTLEVLAALAALALEVLAALALEVLAALEVLDEGAGAGAGGVASWGGMCKRKRCFI